MTSKIKVDNINKVSDDTNIIKKCGTTTTIGSGASNPIVVDGSAVTLGRCGGTVALASGATQTGFGRTGTVDWQTAIKTSGFTAVSGEGYFCNTTGGAFTLTLPASPSVGDIVSFKDYARTFASNSLTVDRNGSNLDGVAANQPFDEEGLSATLIYMDATKGWSLINDDATQGMGALFICAAVSGTGNTLTTDGNFKVATFTGPGSLCVSQIGTGPFSANSQISYMVVAAGGGGGSTPSLRSGGGGGGGFREGKSPVTPYTSSPLNAPTGLTLTTVGSIPVTVGAGGPSTGSDSTFSTISATHFMIDGLRVMVYPVLRNNH